MRLLVGIAITLFVSISATPAQKRSVTCGLALNEFTCDYLPDPNGQFCCDKEETLSPNRFVVCDQQTDIIVERVCDNGPCGDGPNGQAVCP
jgi:hypothetical protein